MNLIVKLLTFTFASRPFGLDQNVVSETVTCKFFDDSVNCKCHMTQTGHNLEHLTSCDDMKTTTIMFETGDP